MPYPSSLPFDAALDAGRLPPPNAAGDPVAVADRPLDMLHPAVWRGHQLGRQVDRTVPSGFPALDEHLPGGGWPQRAITELMLPHPGVGEWRLLADALAQVQRAGRLVMLFDPPAQLSAGSLNAMGIDAAQLLVVDTARQPVPGTDRLWALEQALKSGHVGAVLAWLPTPVRAERLRRLQLAAHVHDGPAFVVREWTAQQQPSAAPLRLAVRPGGVDQLAIDVLKRRGPPLRRPVHLSLPPVLSAAARARAAAPADAADARALPGAVFINLAPFVSTPVGRGPGV